MKFSALMKKLLLSAVIILGLGTATGIIRINDTSPEGTAHRKRNAKRRKEVAKRRKEIARKRESRAEKTTSHQETIDKSFGQKGEHHLIGGIKTTHFSNTGELTITNYRMLSLDQTGPLTIQKSTIQKHANVSGIIEADESSFESLRGTGFLSLKNSKITHKLDNTGKSTLTKCTIETVDITGKTTSSDCSFKSIKVVGSSSLKATTASTGDFVGNFTAEDCSIDDIKATSKTIILTNCKAKMLLIRKDKPTDTPVIHIKAKADAAREIYIAKIVCENPNTKIIYGPGTRRADEILGTTNIIDAE